MRSSGRLLDAHDREQRAAGGLLVDGGVLEDQLGLDVEDPRGVLGPLDVAADPEHRLRDPAQHPGSGRALLLLLGLRRAARAAPARPASPARGGVALDRGSGRVSGGGSGVRRRPRARRLVRVLRLGHQLDLGRPGQHPGVLGAAAARGVHDQLALGQRHPGQPAGQHPDPRAVVDRERPQVDVARPEPAVDEGRHGRQLHHRLGDPRARVLEHLGAQLVELGAARPPGRSRCPCRPSRRPA